MSTLSERLRGGANLPRKPAGLSREDLYEAADELDRLTARVAELEGALRRLWPVLDKATKGLVFTAERAGEVAADMNTLRAALKHKHE